MCSSDCVFCLVLSFLNIIVINETWLGSAVVKECGGR